MAPLAATGGMPIPGKVLAPHSQKCQGRRHAREETLFPGVTTPLANFWLCGASTFPGIGIPPVAASGAMAAHAVLGRETQNSLLRELEL